MCQSVIHWDNDREKRAAHILSDSFDVLLMLIFINYVQNRCYSLLGRLIVYHLVKARFVSQEVYILFDSFNTLLAQFFLSPQYGFRASRQQNVVIQRWDYASAPPIQEPHRKMDAAAAAVTDDVGIITVEDGKSGDAGYRLHPQKIPQKVIHGIISQPKQ